MQEENQSQPTQETTPNEELPEGAIMDTDGNVIENPTSKQLAVVRLAHLIFNDEELLSKALNHCLVDGNQMLTMEEYAGGKRFSSFLKRFPEVKEEYETNRAVEREDKVKIAKARMQANRKARRKLKR